MQALVANTILIIDDDAVMRKMLRLSLEAEKFNVITAANGREGIALFRDREPALVITDILMPEQDGIETIRQIRHERFDAKIIAISGGGRIGRSDLLSIAKKLGADETLAKPFERKDLLALIRPLLARDKAAVPALCGTRRWLESDRDGGEADE
jgi:DNA-binding response OmpR family regulator